MEFSKTQMNLFFKARSIADSSEFERFHIGCIATIGSKIISTGYNSYKTHPIQYKFDKFRCFNCESNPKNIHSIHAEIACLVSIKNENIDFSKVSLYIYRLLKNGGQGLSRPCSACFNFIKHLGIKNIYYTTNYGYAYERLLYND